MITFTDGPAAGVTLDLARTPVFLRVVRAPDGTWDALDQLDDAPRPGEEVYAYRVVGRPTIAFVDYRDKAGRRRGHQTYFGEYRYLFNVQPSEHEARDTAAWRAWTEAHRAATPRQNE